MSWSKHLETNCKKQNTTPNDKHRIFSIFCMPAEKEKIKLLELKSTYLIFHHLYSLKVAMTYSLFGSQNRTKLKD